jgi:hypothetical protein
MRPGVDADKLPAASSGDADRRNVRAESGVSERMLHDQRSRLRGLPDSVSAAVRAFGGQMRGNF